MALASLVALTATIWAAFKLLVVLSASRAGEAPSCHIDAIVTWQVDSFTQGVVAIAFPVQAIVVAAFHPNLWLTRDKLKRVSVLFLVLPASCSIALGVGSLTFRITTGVAMLACFLLALAVAKLSVTRLSKGDTGHPTGA